jgi:hypothetical protein
MRSRKAVAVAVDMAEATAVDMVASTATVAGIARMAVAIMVDTSAEHTSVEHISAERTSEADVTPLGHRPFAAAASWAVARRSAPHLARSIRGAILRAQWRAQCATPPRYIAPHHVPG